MCQSHNLPDTYYNIELAGCRRAGPRGEKGSPFSGFRAGKDGFYGPAISGLKTATLCAGASSSYAAMMQ
jgi:hypothetical protein